MIRIKGALILSLVINVFLIGTVCGGVMRWRSIEHTVSAVAAPRGLRFAAATLSDARKQQFRQTLKETRRDPAMRELAGAAREGRRQVVAALRAPQFDAKALDAALAQTRQADFALRADIEGAVVRFASTLTPDERLKFVAALQQRGPLHIAGRPRAASAESAQ